MSDTTTPLLAALPRPDGPGVNIRPVTLIKRLPDARLLVRDDEGYEHEVCDYQTWADSDGYGDNVQLAFTIEAAVTRTLRVAA